MGQQGRVLDIKNIAQISDMVKTELLTLVQTLHAEELWQYHRYARTTYELRCAYVLLYTFCTQELQSSIMDVQHTYSLILNNPFLRLASLWRQQLGRHIMRALIGEQLTPIRSLLVGSLKRSTVTDED